MQVVCSGGHMKRVAVVAGRHVTGQGASDRVAWHARVQVVRVVVVGSDRAHDPSMWVRGMWVRERVQVRCGL